MDYADPKRFPPESATQSGVRSGATALWHASVGLLIPGAVGVVAGILLAPVLGPLFGMMAALLLFVFGRAAITARRRRAMLLLAYAEQAVRLNLPLVQTLRGWSTGEHRAMRAVLRRAADALEDGGSVAEALRTAAPLLPSRAVDLISTAERNGKLAPAIAQVLRDESRRPLRDPTHWPMVKAYAVVIFLAVAGTIWMLTIFVMPKFQQIFKDFHQQLPPVTRWMIVMSQTIAPLASVAGAVLLILACRAAVDELLRRGLPRRKGFVRMTLDRVRWAIPIVGGLDRDRGLADVLSVIADSLESHRPLHAAVAEASQPHLNVVLSERVDQWGEGLEHGLALGEAARRAGLPPIIAGLLGTAHMPTDVVAVLRFLSRYYGARFSRAVILLREAAVPALALAGGAMVGFVALSIFGPMVSLIESISVRAPGL
jgi:type II secretory pathway component PulF